VNLDLQPLETTSRNPFLNVCGKTSCFGAISILYSRHILLPENGRLQSEQDHQTPAQYPIAIGRKSLGKLKPPPLDENGGMIRTNKEAVHKTRTGTCRQLYTNVNKGIQGRTSREGQFSTTTPKETCGKMNPVITPDLLIPAGMLGTMDDLIIEHTGIFETWRSSN
jgi:hypothetical protein